MRIEKLLEIENKKLVESGILRDTRARISGKTSHKQNVPKNAEKWSIGSSDLILLKASCFFALVEKQKTE